MRKNEGKISIPLLIILVIILIIIIVIALVFFTKNQNNERLNTDNVKVIDDNTIFEDKIINENNIVKEEKKYDVLTEDINYYLNTSKDETFRVQDVIHNADNTITLKGRVYKYLDLPALTKAQYNALLEGKSLDILGEKVTKEPDNTRAEEAGYEISLVVETKEHEDEMIYYANRNADGSATLYYGSDTKLAEGTDIYLKLTLRNDTICEINEQETTIEKYYTQDIHREDKNLTRLYTENIEFAFEQGECWLVLLSET